MLLLLYASSCLCAAASCCVSCSSWRAESAVRDDREEASWRDNSAADRRSCTAGKSSLWACACMCVRVCVCVCVCH